MKEVAMEMEALKDDSIKVYYGMNVVSMHLPLDEVLELSLAPKFNNSYAINNSTICYVVDGEIYVTPFTRSILSTLARAGFRQEYFYVPFSNGDYPRDERNRWYQLQEKARESSRKDIENDCIVYAEKNHIGTISDEILKNCCFRMPQTGVRVKRWHFEACYHPIIHSVCDRINERVGCFCYNNGNVVFVYRDGTTYVAKGYGIIDVLSKAGYRKYPLFVPFSNGEQIQDPALKRYWESITPLKQP